MQSNGTTLEIDARLIVGADGKHSGMRQFTGGETHADPESHRFGGVLMTGVNWQEYTDDYDNTPDRVVNWFPISKEYTRIYIGMRANEIEAAGIARSFETFVAYSATATPDGLLDHAEQAGPIAFFPNQDIWTTRISGEGVTLIGDAAGSVDPTQGHGTPLLMRDIRELSEALLDGPDWQQAIDGYAERRRNYYEVLHAYDTWSTVLSRDRGLVADRLREQNKRAEDADPTLGGWNQIEARGPDGLLPDEAARRHYFGEDL